MGRYDDIINHEPWEPRGRKRMPTDARAAQFAPFAALRGHEEAIREVEEESARLYDKPRRKATGKSQKG